MMVPACITIAIDRKWDEMQREIRRRFWYCEKGREGACALRVTMPPQKGDRSSVKDV